MLGFDLDLYSPPYNSTDFSYFLRNLTVVVDKCLEVGVAPIIGTLRNHDGDGNGNVKKQ